MVRIPLFLGVCLISLNNVTAQVRIHDTAVRLLAKPFGIEKRIELISIDGLFGSPDGTKRIQFTLRNSGVKEVTLKQPVFSLDLVLPDGTWASLGSLSGAEIIFPITDESKKVTHTYMAKFESKLPLSDIQAYLRDGAATTTRVRLLGHAEMNVGSGGKSEFTKKNLKLELGGRLNLSPDFKAVEVPSATQLPTVGKQ